MAYITEESDGDAASVVRPTGAAAARPVDRVQLAPALVERQISPSVEPERLEKLASMLAVKVPSEGLTTDQTNGCASTPPVASETTLNWPPALVERNKPWFVATITTLLSVFDTAMSLITVELPRKTGDDQCTPPSVDLSRPTPVASIASPSPR